MKQQVKRTSILGAVAVRHLGTTALSLALMSTVPALPAGAQNAVPKEKAIAQPAPAAKATTSPPAGRVRVRAASQDYDESAVVACLKEFQQYKSQQTGSRFVVRFSAGYYHCVNDKPQTLPATAPATARPAVVTPALVARGQPSNLRLWFSQGAAKLDGQIVAQAVNEFLTQRAINPYSDTIFDFVFDPHGIGTYKEVAVQFFRAAPEAEAGNPCAGWDTSPELIQQFIVPVQKATAKDANPAWSQLRVDTGKMLKSMPNHSKMDVYVRIVPVKDLRPPIRGITGRPASGTCVLGPSTNVVLLKAEMNDIGQNIAEYAKKQQEAETAYAAALKQAVGDDPAAKSPITVEVLSYFPPFIADTYDDSDELITLKPIDPEYFPHFPMGCAFNALEYSTVGPPKHWYDPIVEVIDGYAQVWNMMENFAADAIETAVTLGACTPPDMTSGAGGSSSQVCKDIYGTAGAGVRIAASAVGLPPSLPTASGLVDDGLDWVAQQGVDFALSNIPGGELLEGPVRDALIEKVKEQERQALKLNACTFANPNGPVDGSVMGWSKDPDSGCYTSFAQIYSLGKKNFAMYPRDALIYLRVKRNPNGIQLSRSMKLHVTLGEYFDAVRDSYYVQTPALDVPINVAKIPDAGFVIPVTFFPNLAMFLKEGKEGFVNNSGYAPDQARDAWIVQAYQAGKASHIQITSDYTWANDGVLIAGTKHKATVTAKFWDQQVPINKEIALDKSFTDSVRVTSPAACPGFEFAPGDNPPHKTYLKGH